MLPCFFYFVQKLKSDHIVTVHPYQLLYSPINSKTGVGVPAGGSHSKNHGFTPELYVLSHAGFPLRDCAHREELGSDD